MSLSFNKPASGNTTYTVPLAYFNWFGINCMKTDIFCFICKTDQNKPVRQEVNSTVILPL